MIHIRPEGDLVKTGINFYPLKEWAYSRGFVLKFGSWQYQVRYAAKQEKWRCGLRQSAWLGESEQ